MWAGTSRTRDFEGWNNCGHRASIAHLDAYEWRSSQRLNSVCGSEWILRRTRREVGQVESSRESGTVEARNLMDGSYSGFGRDSRPTPRLAWPSCRLEINNLVLPTRPIRENPFAPPISSDEIVQPFRLRLLCFFYFIIVLFCSSWVWNGFQTWNHETKSNHTRHLCLRFALCSSKGFRSTMNQLFRPKSFLPLNWHRSCAHSDAVSSVGASKAPISCCLFASLSMSGRQ